ncbi:MAG TPA: hypothetical protein VFN87_21455 [Solirubrobacteraceae bacterium]|nr:hypothetical protein [Solirubrobacteraceae bacterium]
MPLPPPPEPLFLACDPDPVFVTLHRPVRTDALTAVLFCPPFGWEEVCSYRSIRFWATQLAAAGFAAVRVSLPGTGDSGGSPRDPGLIAGWGAAVAATAAWLRRDAGAERVVAVGMGMGGLIAGLATANGAAVDDLVFWATPARGRTLVRQLRTFSQLERAQIYDGVQHPPPGPSDGLESGGFLLTGESVTALESIDLREVRFPAAAGRHALVLGRDGLGSDDALSAHLVAEGMVVSTDPGVGFADMTSHPQTARPPLGVIERVGRWLAELPSRADSGPAPVPASAPRGRPECELRFAATGRSVRETPVTIAHPRGRLTGILSEPVGDRADGPAVILLNPGAVRRIGPNRMWVEAARRWAAAGVATLRLDAEALGDSDGDETPYADDAPLYSPYFVSQVISAMDFLQRRGVARRFVLGGLCSGANWSLHAARRDDRVAGLLLINPRVLVWRPDLGAERDMRALLTQRPSLSRIRRLARGRRLRELIRWLTASPMRLVGRRWRQDEDAAARSLHADLIRLAEAGCRVLWLFSAYEPLHDELVRSGWLARMGTSPHVVVESVPVRDHTLRPGWAQHEVHGLLDRALASVPGMPEVAGMASIGQLAG